MYKTTPSQGFGRRSLTFQSAMEIGSPIAGVDELFFLFLFFLAAADEQGRQATRDQGRLDQGQRGKDKDRDPSARREGKGT